MTVLESRSRGPARCPSCGGVLDRDGPMAECRRCRRRAPISEVVG